MLRSWHFPGQLRSDTASANREIKQRLPSGWPKLPMPVHYPAPDAPPPTDCYFPGKGIFSLSQQVHLHPQVQVLLSITQAQNTNSSPSRGNPGPDLPSQTVTLLLPPWAFSGPNSDQTLRLQGPETLHTPFSGLLAI